MNFVNEFVFVDRLLRLLDDVHGWRKGPVFSPPRFIAGGHVACPCALVVLRTIKCLSVLHTLCYTAPYIEQLLPLTVSDCTKLVTYLFSPCLISQGEELRQLPHKGYDVVQYMVLHNMHKIEPTKGVSTRHCYHTGAH